MKDNERLYNALYEFILFELDKRERELRTAEDCYRSNRSTQNLHEVFSAKVKMEYFKGWYSGLLEYLKYFSQ